MATNMAPHNLGEVIDGICAQIDNPNITVKELDEIHQRAGFPDRLHGLRPGGHQGVFHDRARQRQDCAARSAWKSSRAGASRSSSRKFPYNVNRAVLVERIAELVNEKVITDITAMRDESDENTRVVIEIKRDAIAKVVINNLYKHTALESFVRVNALAIDHGRPKTLGLKELINCYIEHRREVVIRRTRFELRKAEERAETPGRLPHRPGQPGRIHPHHPRQQQPRGGPHQAARVRVDPRSRSSAGAFSSAAKRA